MCYDHYQVITPCKGCGCGIKPGPRIICDTCYQKMKDAESKKKFVIEFEEEPSLLFVQFGVGSKCKLYQDGKEVKGIRSIRINAAYDDATTHEIEYLTGATKDKG